MRGGGGVGAVGSGAATTGGAPRMSEGVMLIFGSSTGAFAQPKTVQPPFSA
jgi:hypothetical protein